MVRENVLGGVDFDEVKHLKNAKVSMKDDLCPYTLTREDHFEFEYSVMHKPSLRHHSPFPGLPRRYVGTRPTAEKPAGQTRGSPWHARRKTPKVVAATYTAEVQIKIRA
jgi:hypothetical protein